MNRSWLVLLLSGCSLARIPFYCKIRKVDCQLRPDSKCCQYTTTTATTATTITTTTTTTTDTDTTLTTNLRDASTKDIIHKVAISKENKNESLIDTKGSDVITAEPSEIDEVVVKITGEAVEANLLTTAKPEKFAPRFCLKLKFNCKLRSRHPCCQYPLPPSEEVKVPTTASVNSEKLKVRQPRKQSLPESSTTTTTRSNSLRKSQRKRYNLIQSSKLQSEKEDEVVDELKERSAIVELKVPTDTKKNFNRKSLSRPQNSLFKRKRRPIFGGNNKPAVCRIINCKRNQNHKCCQEQEKASKVVTTEQQEIIREVSPTVQEETRTEVTTDRELTTADAMRKEREKNITENTEILKNDMFTTESLTVTTMPAVFVSESTDNNKADIKDTFEEMSVVSQKESVTAVETRVVQATGQGARVENNEDQTLENSEVMEYGQDMTYEATTDMQEEFIEYFQADNDVFEEDDETDGVVNVYPVFIPEVQEIIEARKNEDHPPDPQPSPDLLSLSPSLFIPKHSEHSPVFSSKHSGLPPVFVPEYLEHSPVFYYQHGEHVVDDIEHKNREHVVNDIEYKNGEHAVNDIEHKNGEHIVNDIEHKNDEHVVNDIEYKNNEHVVNNIEHKNDEHVVNDIEHKNNEHKTGEDEEDNVTSPSSDCSTLDCLVLPGHACCSPHIASKRQADRIVTGGATIEDSDGDSCGDNQDHHRVTSTVTRVVKSVRW